MLSQGPYSPAATGNESRSGASAHWSNTDAAKVSDNTYASVDLTPANYLTHYITFRDFGFSVPASAVIVGVEVQIEQRRIGGLTNIPRDDNVLLVTPSGTTGNLSDGSMFSATEAIRTFGGDSILWGLSLTPADVNSADFRVYVSAYRFTGTSTAQIDHVTVTVYYEETTAPTVSMSLTSESPAGPLEKPVTVAIELTAQSPAIEQAATVTITLSASEAIGPRERSPGVSITLIPLDAIGPLERPASNTIVFTAELPIQPVEKLVLAVAAMMTNALNDVAAAGTVLGIVCPVHVEPLGQANLAMASEAVNGSQTPAVLAALSQLLREPLEPTLAGIVSTPIGEREVLLTSLAAIVAEPLQGPLPTALLAIASATLTESLPASIAAIVSDRLTETIEPLTPALIAAVAPSLIEPPEPLLQAVAAIVSAQPTLSTTVLAAISPALIELPGQPTATTVAAMVSAQPTLSTTILAAISPALIELPGQPTATTVAALTASGASQVIVPTTAAVLAVVSDRLTETIEVSETTILAAVAAEQGLGYLETAVAALVSRPIPR